MRLPWRIPSFGPAIETSLTVSEAAELRTLAAGCRVLEIGAAFGYSTILMAQVAKSVVSVDPHEAHQSLDRFRASLSEHGVGRRVVVHVGTSAEILPGLRDGRFDLIFVDGDHTVAGVSHDLEQAQRVVALGGALAFHDWDEDSCPGVRLALEPWRRPDYLVDTLAVYRLG